MCAILFSLSTKQISICKFKFALAKVYGTNIGPEILLVTDKLVDCGDNALNTYHLAPFGLQAFLFNVVPQCVQSKEGEVSAIYIDFLFIDWVHLLKYNAHRYCVMTVQTQQSGIY